MFCYLDDGKKELSDKVIKQVKYTVNDNNMNNKREQKMAITKLQPFLLSRLGNKPVVIKIEITFRKWTRLLPATYNHTLCFEGNKIAVSDDAANLNSSSPLLSESPGSVG